MKEVRMRSVTLPITDEIQSLLNGYDFYTMYIEDYSQMKKAEEINSVILKRLRELVVEAISNNGDVFYEI
jgi:hypothetical protein